MPSNRTLSRWTDKALLASWREAEARGKCIAEWCQEYKLPVYTTYPRLYELLNEVKPKAKQVEILVMPKPLVLDRASVMLVSDIQIPTTDWELASMVTYVAKQRMKPPRHCIIAGDLLNYEAWSSYPAVIPPAKWQDEKEAARKLLNSWLEVFDSIDWIFGNHERRRLKALNAVESEVDIINVLNPVHKERMRVCVLDRMTVNTPNGTWMVAHGGDYSQALLNKQDMYAQKYQMHIASGHVHRLGLGIDRYNRYMIVSLGGLFDVEKMAYVQVGTTSRPEMSQGFVLLNEGYPELYSPILTDWSKI